MSALTPRLAQYPDAEHADVWLKAQSALFDFFDRCRVATPAAAGK